MDGESLNIKEDNLQKLKELFPDVFTENQIDWEKLKATFSDDINFNNERYVLNWAGKADAFKCLQIPTTATLTPQQEKSINFDNTQNVFIEGENLEVLKVLQKSYYGKIKCIIIDPPYNTGSDSFIYPDSFKENKADYEKRVGDKDEEGYLMKEGFFRKNSKDSGHFHSNWLSMMYPRLFLAKNLLRDDGVIFIHIDYNEVHNLRLLMNEIFGEENFVEVFSWVKTSTPPALSNKSRKTIEYILCFEKNKNTKRYYSEPLEGGDQPLLNEGNEIAILVFPKEKVVFNIDDGFYPKGNYHRIKLLDDIEVKNGFAKQDFKLEGRFKWKQSFLKNELDNGTTFIIKSEKFAIRFQRVGDEGFKTPTNLIKSKYSSPIINKIENGVGTNETSSSELEVLLQGKYFDFPKPMSLEKYLLNFITENNDIVLDFFAGSGTVAQALLELNKEDGGNREFILVQLPELIDENIEAYKAGYKTIADISKERIRRVINKIEKEKVEKPKMFDNDTLDLGFKVFKLSPSNFKIWRSEEITEDNLSTQLDAFTNPIKHGSEKQNMLFELMLKAGYTLTDKTEEKENFYTINYGELIIALEKIDQEIVDEIINSHPKKVITLDNLFAGNDQLKTNTVLQMRDAGVEFKTI